MSSVTAKVNRDDDKVAVSRSNSPRFQADSRFIVLSQ